MKKIIDKLSVVLLKEPHVYGKLKFIDANDNVVGYIDCLNTSEIKTELYNEIVEYTKLADTNNVYLEVVVAQIKFLNITKEEIKNRV